MVLKALACMLMVVFVAGGCVPGKGESRASTVNGDKTRDLEAREAPSKRPTAKADVPGQRSVDTETRGKANVSGTARSERTIVVDYLRYSVQAYSPVNDLLRRDRATIKLLYQKLAMLLPESAEPGKPLPRHVKQEQAKLLSILQPLYDQYRRFESEMYKAEVPGKCQLLHQYCSERSAANRLELEMRIEEASWTHYPAEAYLRDSAQRWRKARDDGERAMGLARIELSLLEAEFGSSLDLPMISGLHL